MKLATSRSFIVAKNKKAFFNYEMVHKYEAGIILSGQEVKSIRAGKAQLVGSFVSLKKDEAFVHNMNISINRNAFTEETTPRKLLLHKVEIKRLKKRVDNEGMTIVPIALKISSKGIIKLNISLAKGKTKTDKRQIIKKRDTDRKIKKYI